MLLDILFGKKTVDGVLATFNRTIDKLQEVEAQQMRDAEEHAQTIAEKQLAQKQALEEAQRARQVAARMKNIVSLDFEADAGKVEAVGS